MSEISEPLRSELSEALRGNDGQLGRVFVLLEEGKTTNRELAEGGGAANPGAAANLRVTVKAVLDGVLPKGPTVAAQSRRSIGGLLRDNPDLSTAARLHLDYLRTCLEEIANDSEGLEIEAHRFKQASETLKLSLEKLPGVYVYSLPSFRRTVQMTDPDRFWFKIGKTDRFTGKRVDEQMKITSLPEDPWIARVYRHETLTPKELESTFHHLLIAAGHVRAQGKHAGLDWFATNTCFLDGIAKALGCERAADDEPEDE